MSTSTYQIHTPPKRCPEKFWGFDKPISAYKNEWSLTTMVGYLVLTECGRELGLRNMESIDERTRCGVNEYYRGDVDADLNHLLLAALGKVNICNNDVDLNYDFTLEIAPYPSKALHYLHDVRVIKAREKGHNWESISQGITSPQEDTKINIIIATKQDSKGTTITRGKGPYQAVDKWEKEGLVPAGYADLAVSGAVRPIEILRSLGLPVVVIENHVDCVERLKWLISKEIARQTE